MGEALLTEWLNAKQQYEQQVLGNTRLNEGYSEYEKVLLGRLMGYVALMLLCIFLFALSLQQASWIKSLCFALCGILSTVTSFRIAQKMDKLGRENRAECSDKAYLIYIKHHIETVAGIRKHGWDVLLQSARQLESEVRGKRQRFVQGAFSIASVIFLSLFLSLILQSATEAEVSDQSSSFLILLMFALIAAVPLITFSFGKGWDNVHQHRNRDLKTIEEYRTCIELIVARSSKRLKTRMR